MSDTTALEISGVWISDDRTELAISLVDGDESQTFIIKPHLGNYGPEPHLVEVAVQPEVLKEGWTYYAPTDQVSKGRLTMSDTAPETVAQAGTVKASPFGSDVAVMTQIVAGAYPWFSIMHSTRLSDAQVTDWPVIGVVPGTPAARSTSGTPTPTAAVLDQMERLLLAVDGIVMDSPEDRERHQRLTRTFWEYLRKARGSAGTAALTEDPVAEFLRWLVLLDDPADAQGVEDRRTVTLNQIIERARQVQAGGLGE